MHRQPHRTSLVGQSAGDGLANPPSGVRGEFVAPPPIELLDGTHEPEVALLYQIAEAETPTQVIPRDRDHQPQVGLDHLTARFLVTRLDALCQFHLFARGQQGRPPDISEIDLERRLARVGAAVQDIRFRLFQPSPAPTRQTHIGIHFIPLFCHDIYQETRSNSVQWGEP